MIQSIISGILGAIVGAIALYFLLGIPGEVNDLGKTVSKIEGRVETLIALQGKVEKLESRVETVEDEVSVLTGKSKKHGSGWITFNHPKDLKAGSKLELFIGGSAEKVIVRLLPEGKSPDFPVGVLPEIFVVPDNRLLSVVLKENHAAVTHVSVHGGPNPWGKFPLGENNGPATLERISVK